METAKLLPRLVKGAKDAAQSVKRSIGFVIEYVKEKRLSKILDLAYFDVYGSLSRRPLIDFTAMTR